MTTKTTEPIKISPPRIGRAAFHIEGTAPLMTARFSKKAELMAKMQEGSTARSKRQRDARDFETDAEAMRPWVEQVYGLLSAETQKLRKAS